DHRGSMKLVRGQILLMAAALAAMFAFDGPAGAVSATDLCSYAPAPQVKVLLGASPADTETSAPPPDENRSHLTSTACQFSAGGRAVVVYLVEYPSVDAAKAGVQNEFNAAAKDKSAKVGVASVGVGDETYEAVGPDAMMYISRKGSKVFAAGVIGVSIS